MKFLNLGDENWVAGSCFSQSNFAIKFYLVYFMQFFKSAYLRIAQIARRFAHDHL